MLAEPKRTIPNLRRDTNSTSYAMIVVFLFVKFFIAKCRVVSLVCTFEVWSYPLRFLSMVFKEILFHWLRGLRFKIWLFKVQLCSCNIDVVYFYWSILIFRVSQLLDVSLLGMVYFHRIFSKEKQDCPYTTGTSPRHGKQDPMLFKCTSLPFPLFLNT